MEDFFSKLTAAFKKFIADIDPEIQKITPIVIAGAQVAQTVAPYTGTAAPGVAAGSAATIALATAIDNAAIAHQAAGSTSASAAAGLASVAQAVAAQSGNIGISPDTAAQITTMTAALAPEVAQVMTTIPAS